MSIYLIAFSILLVLAGVAISLKTKKWRRLSILCLGLSFVLGIVSLSFRAEELVAAKNSSPAETKPMDDFFSGKEVDFNKVHIQIDGHNLPVSIRMYLQKYDLPANDYDKAYGQLMEAVGKARIHLELPPDFPIEAEAEPTATTPQ